MNTNPTYEYIVDQVIDYDKLPNYEKDLVVKNLQEYLPVIQTMSKEEHGPWSFHAKKALQIISYHDFIKSQNKRFVLFLIISFFAIIILICSLIFDSLFLFIMGTLSFFGSMIFFKKRKKLSYE